MYYRESGTTQFQSRSYRKYFSKLFLSTVLIAFPIYRVVLPTSKQSYYLKEFILQLAYLLGFDMIKVVTATIHSTIFNNMHWSWCQEDKERDDETIARNIKISDFSIRNPGVFWYTYLWELHFSLPEISILFILLNKHWILCQMVALWTWIQSLQSWMIVMTTVKAVWEAGVFVSLQG